MKITLSCVALVLEHDEWVHALESYCTGSPSYEEALSSVMDGYETLSDIPFTRSDGEGEFHVIPLTTLDGAANIFGCMHFSAFTIAGQSSPRELNANEDLFVIPGDRQRGTLTDVTGPLYTGYSEIEREFFNMLGKYVPANFNWRNHTGILSADLKSHSPHGECGLK